jgi:hypothetical protein
MKVTLFFAWYDLWAGCFYDYKKRIIYICLVPCVVIKITLKSHREKILVNAQKSLLKIIGSKPEGEVKG